MRSASREGDTPCQREATNPKGVRHSSRQRYLRALHWNSPAPASTAAPIIQPLATNHPLRAAAQRTAASTRWAAIPNASQAARNPSTTSAASRPASGRAPVIRRNIASSGKLVGSIIAAIISTQAAAWSTAGTTMSPCGTALHSAASAPTSPQPP